MLVGFLAMGYIMLRRKNLYNTTAVQSCLFTVLLMLSGLAGCKLLYVLENLHETMETGISLGGFSFFGAVFLVPVVMPLFGRLFRLSARQSLDASALCVVIMVGTIRFGCFLNGCCGGWMVEIGQFRFRWPTQAMESIGDFAILFWLLSFQERKKQQGTLYPLFMLAYSGMRFLIEFLRDTPKDWLYLSHGQWFSLVAILCGFAALYKMKQ